MRPIPTPRWLYEFLKTLIFSYNPYSRVYYSRVYLGAGVTGLLFSLLELERKKNRHLGICAWAHYMECGRKRAGTGKSCWAVSPLGCGWKDGIRRLKSSRGWTIEMMSYSSSEKTIEIVQQRIEFEDVLKVKIQFLACCKRPWLEEE